MKLTPRGRRIASVLVVVFALTTVASTYYLYAETHPSGGPSTTTLATFSQSSVGGFTATVLPSSLYNNSTEVSGGNLTLFSPITQVIHASIAYTLETNRTAAVSLSDVFSVSVSTPGWSKTLLTTQNNSSTPATTLLALGFHYAINVSSISDLVATIDGQLSYQSPSFTVALDPVITGGLEVAGVSDAIAADPSLTFTFVGSLIVPSGLGYTAPGAVVTSNGASGASGTAVDFAYLFFAASVGALAVGAWIATRRVEGSSVPPLEEVIQPYEEAIATVSAPPRETIPVDVPTFVDLAKIADTLGKPILRTGPGGSDGRTFYVLDGFLAFTYRYPDTTGTADGGAGAEEGPGSGDEGPAVARLLARMQTEVRRLQQLSMDTATVAVARRGMSRAMELLRAGRIAEAEIEVDLISRLVRETTERSPVLLEGE